MGVENVSVVDGSLELADFNLVGLENILHPLTQH